MDFQIKDCSEGKFYELDDLNCDYNTSLQSTFSKLNAIITNDSTHKSIIDNLKSLEKSNKIDVVVDEDVQTKVKIALQDLSKIIANFNTWSAKYRNLLGTNISLKYDGTMDAIGINFDISFTCYGEYCTFDVIYKQDLCHKCKLFSATLSNNM